jgi:hypothetical protein
MIAQLTKLIYAGITAYTVWKVMPLLMAIVAMVPAT